MLREDYDPTILRQHRDRRSPNRWILPISYYESSTDSRCRKLCFLWLPPTRDRIYLSILPFCERTNEPLSASTCFWKTILLLTPVALTRDHWNRAELSFRHSKDISHRKTCFWRLLSTRDHKSPSTNRVSLNRRLSAPGSREHFYPTTHKQVRGESKKNYCPYPIPPFRFQNNYIDFRAKAVVCDFVIGVWKQKRPRETCDFPRSFIKNMRFSGVCTFSCIDCCTIVVSLL